MYRCMWMLVAGVLACLAGVRAGGGPIFTQGPDGSGKVGYTPPDLNDENTHSNFLPTKLRCQGCKAVAYQLFKAFRSMDRKRPSLKGRFPESLIYRVTDSVCEEKEAFEKYGLKSINNDEDLLGPGMDIPDDAPGVKQEGGMWPARLRDMCTEFIDKEGDRQLFRMYKKHNTLVDYTNYLCYQSGALGNCKGQDKYKVPEKVQEEDIQAFSHDQTRNLEDADVEEEGELLEEDNYYADDNEEDYDEDYYEDDENLYGGSEDPERLKRSADKKKST